MRISDEKRETIERYARAAGIKYRSAARNFQRYEKGTVKITKKVTGIVRGVESNAVNQKPLPEKVKDFIPSFLEKLLQKSHKPIDFAKPIAGNIQNVGDFLPDSETVIRTSRPFRSEADAQEFIKSIESENSGEWFDGRTATATIVHYKKGDVYFDKQHKTKEDLRTRRPEIASKDVYIVEMHIALDVSEAANLTPAPPRQRDKGGRFIPRHEEKPLKLWQPKMRDDRGRFIKRYEGAK